MSPGGAAVGADLGGSSKYSNENFEGRRGERFHVNGTCTWEVGSSGRKSTARRVVSGAPPAALANPEDRVPSAPGRTHNRIRSPRRTASGRWNKVGKGSRQNGSVTSGKGLALRAGHGGPSPEPVGCRCTARAAPAARAGRPVPVGGRTGNGSFGGLPRATNSRLRTGTDKGNPTI
ncbi:hypothetical protein V6N13_019136 [Hibiscus sabdariffa]